MPGYRRRPLALLAIALATVLGLVACTSSGGGGNTAQGAPGGAGDDSPMTISFEPADGSDAVAPRAPVPVTVEGGTLTEIALTNPEGKQVEGTLSEDKTAWQVAEPLGYGKQYTWSGTARDAGGKDVPVKGSFTTVNPSATNGVRSNVGDGNTYGIAMPISLTFDAPVKDKAAVEKALSVKTSPENEGAWAWLSDQSVHWRPKEYWQPNTEVEVNADLYGVHFGDGVYGDNDLAVTFSIGRAQIAKGNTQTHRFEIYRDGEKVADYPASYGRESDPNLVTRSGVHVVMSKHAKYFMNNPGYGYEDFEVAWAVRISNNGEFTHAAPWSVGDQGRANVSHGCINLSDANAKEFYDSALPGDPVEITGSSEQLSERDGLYHDWIYSWEEWQSFSALDG
ncbi:L,D-transpeptidase [Saccharomonospora azurea]|uniref:L,D-transpeptidase n=1 Tax=Saccharomonospora azurea TaxID=40988 RepID=UPI00030BA284|nr:Ig-like domain-containing protein [Saccharomonospora azurea]